MLVVQFQKCIGEWVNFVNVYNTISFPSAVTYSVFLITVTYFSEQSLGSIASFKLLPSENNKSVILTLLLTEITPKCLICTAVVVYGEKGQGYYLAVFYSASIL